jgi:hypothetical protein
MGATMEDEDEDEDAGGDECAEARDAATVMGSVSGSLSGGFRQLNIGQTHARVTSHLTVETSAAV